MYGGISPEQMLTTALAQYQDWYVMRDVLIPAEDRSMHIDFLLVFFSLAFPILFFCGGESSYPLSGFFSLYLSTFYFVQERYYKRSNL